MNSAYLLDASALLALLNDEAGADGVTRLVRAAESGECELFMAKLNLLEVYYCIYRKRGKERATQVLQMVLGIPVDIIERLDHSVFLDAGRLKATYRLSLADAIAVAEARVRGASLVTSDHRELDVLEKEEEAAFHWIR